VLAPPHPPPLAAPGPPARAPGADGGRQVGPPGLAPRRTGEVEQGAQGTFHLERRLAEEPQTILFLRSRRCILEQEVHEPENAEQGIGHVVCDVRGQVAERGRPCQRDELALDGGAVVVRERQ